FVCGACLGWPPIAPAGPWGWRERQLWGMSTRSEHRRRMLQSRRLQRRAILARTTFIVRHPDSVMTSRHIGIVACSAEGAALCYRTICIEGAAILGPHAHPEVTVHTPSLADYMACIYRNDWAGVGELMLASANKLKAVGADFLICPDNTIHQALPYVVQRSPLPWLHIAEEV